MQHNYIHLIRTNLSADSTGLCLTGAKRHGACRHGAQVQPLQEGQVQVPLEVEEEAHSPLAEEAPQDETALQVMKKTIWHGHQLNEIYTNI